MYRTAADAVVLAESGILLLGRLAENLRILTHNQRVGGGQLVAEVFAHHFRGGGGVHRRSHAQTHIHRDACVSSGLGLGLGLLIGGWIKAWSAN